MLSVMKMIHKKLAYFVIVIFISVVFLTGRAVSAEQRNIVGWVGLWNTSMVEWAENENRLHRLCPKSMAEKDRTSCKNFHLRSKTWAIPTFLKPNTASTKTGEILIEITPGMGFKISYQPKGKEAISFTPDLYDPDWGYGPYFHQTVLEVKGDWVLLPKIPFHQPVWINASKLIGQKDILALKVGGIYWLNKKEIVIVKKTKSGVFLRPEQRADMWCEGGEPPPIKSVKPDWVSNELLYDKNGHLKLTIVYTRGC